MEATAGLVLKLQISAEHGVSGVRCLLQLCQATLYYGRQEGAGDLCSVAE